MVEESIIDSLCKYWESDLKKTGMAYGKEYAQFHKEMRVLLKRDLEVQISKDKFSIFN